MNKFDFFNYNFSALISIFAALLGMAYPLILQAIQRVDDMYNSTVLAKYVQRQFAFRLFNGLLLLAIVASISVPFIIAYLLENAIVDLVIEMVHAIIITALICAAIYLFKFILITTRPDDFLEYISNGNTPDSPSTHEILQIAKYASDHESYGLYSKAMGIISDTFSEALRRDDESKELPADICNTLTDIRSIASTKGHRFFNDGDVIVPLFYGGRRLFEINEVSFMQIWRIIDNATDKDLFPLVKRYWMSVGDYYQMQVTSQGSPRNGNGWDDVWVFRDFHYRIGMMLVIKEQWKELTQLIMPRDVEKVDTPLVPTSLFDILEFAKRTSSASYISGAIPSKYTLNCLSDSIFGYEHFEKASLRYAALLVIRLSLVGNYFRRDDHCWDAPVFEDMDQKTKRLYLNLLNGIKNEIAVWFDEKLESLKILIPMCAAKAHYIDELEKVRTLCVTSIGAATENQEISEKINRYIQDSIVEKEEFLPLAETYSSISICEKESHIERLYYAVPVMDKDLNDESILSNGMLSLLVEYVCRQAWRSYHYIFVKTPPRIKYDVFGGEIHKALDMLGVNNDHVILFSRISKAERKYMFRNGTYRDEGGIETYNGARIQQMPGSTRFCIVIRKEQMPYCQPVPTDDSREDYMETSPNSLVYTNAVAMIGEDENTRYLRLSRSFCFYEPKNFMRYIKLEINQTRISSQLASIKLFSESIPK